jgi:transposase
VIGYGTDNRSPQTPYKEVWAEPMSSSAISAFQHYRINHTKLFADRQTQINGIENFWNQTKRHMRKFNGVPRAHFLVVLKECEWRFNNPNTKSQRTN